MLKRAAQIAAGSPTTYQEEEESAMFSLQAPHSLVYMIRMKKRDKGWIRIPNSLFNRKCAGSSLPFSVRGKRLRKG